MDQIDRKKCKVCSRPGIGFYFGTFACRPCALFFRRSVQAKRKYNCCHAGNCPIAEEGMRNSCRACRFRCCSEAGMRMEFKGGAQFNICLMDSSAISSQEHQQFDQNQKQQIKVVQLSAKAKAAADLPAAESLYSPSIATLQFSLDTPVISQFAKSLRHYKEGMRAFCAQRFGLGPLLLGHNVHMVNYEECLELCKANAPLLMEFVRSQFPAIDKLSLQMQNHFYKELNLIYLTLDSFHLTIQTYPECKIHNLLVIYPGCAMQEQNYGRFWSKAQGIGKEEQIRIGGPLIGRYLDFVNNHYKRLSVTQMEFTALYAIILWNSIVHLVSAEIVTPIDAIFGELHSLTITHFQQQQQKEQIPAIRFGHLLNLLNQTSIMAHELGELFTLNIVFMDLKEDFNSVWDNALTVYSGRRKDGLT